MTHFDGLWGSIILAGAVSAALGVLWRMWVVPAVRSLRDGIAALINLGERFAAIEHAVLANGDEYDLPDHYRGRTLRSLVIRNVVVMDEHVLDSDAHMRHEAGLPPDGG